MQTSRSLFTVNTEHCHLILFYLTFSLHHTQAIKSAQTPHSVLLEVRTSFGAENSCFCSTTFNAIQGPHFILPLP